MDKLNALNSIDSDNKAAAMDLSLQSLIVTQNTRFDRVQCSSSSSRNKPYIQTESK